jgi:hypothetical protein
MCAALTVVRRMSGPERVLSHPTAPTPLAVGGPTMSAHSTNQPPSRSAQALHEALRQGWIDVDLERGFVFSLRRCRGTHRPFRVGLRGNCDGYLWFRISHLGRNPYVFVHRAVWVAANGAVPEGFEIDHVNCKRADNRLSNLRLLTHARNVPRGRHASRAGEANGNSLLTLAQVKEIRRRWAAGGECQAAIAADYGTNRQYISDIVRGRAWNLSKWDGEPDGPGVGDD